MKKATNMLRNSSWLLLMPVCLFLVVCFVTPIAYIFYLSLTDPSLGLGHYKNILTTPIYALVMFNTLKISVLSTVLCLLLGYPLAYVIVRRPGLLANVLMACVVMSFWIGMIARTYAWLVILGNRGVIASFFAYFDLGKAPQILFTSTATLIGTTHILLPFMVLSLYGVMISINPLFDRAAISLGARPIISFWYIFLPLSLPGVINGSILVFLISLGFFVTPVLLGTFREMVISQLIDQHIEELLNWGFASSLSVILLLTTILILAVFNRYTRIAATIG